MKKFISLLMIVIMCGAFGINVCAYEYANNEAYQFICQDGSIIQYYLDENLYPYHYINGEKVYFALPLEHLKVTDPELIAYLNDQILNTQEPLNRRATPTNYFDMSRTSANQNSIEYTQYVSNLTAGSVNTRILKLNASHGAMRMQTNNLVKAHFWNMSKIKFSYYCYSIYTDEWFSPFTKTENCTVADGFAFQHAPDINPYGYFTIYQDSGIVSFDLRIWTTYTW